MVLSTADFPKGHTHTALFVSYQTAAKNIQGKDQEKYCRINIRTYLYFYGQSIPHASSPFPKWYHTFYYTDGEREHSLPLPTVCNLSPSGNFHLWLEKARKASFLLSSRVRSQKKVDHDRIDDLRKSGTCQYTLPKKVESKPLLLLCSML